MYLAVSVKVWLHCVTSLWLCSVCSVSATFFGQRDFLPLFFPFALCWVVSIVRVCVFSNVARCPGHCCVFQFCFVSMSFFLSFFSAVGKSVQNRINLALPGNRHLMREKHESGFRTSVHQSRSQRVRFWKLWLMTAVLSREETSTTRSLSAFAMSF